MLDYAEEYRRLNDKQQQAVDTIEGPLLVIAGPGTGKTQLLSMRVASILQKTDTSASNILCLTFTNKAATNMRERLLALVGPEARDVTAKTFHSFAAEVMNQYPDHFWNGARLATAPETVQLEIIESCLAKLPLDNPLALRFSGAYTAINDVQQGLKLTKEAGLTPAQLQSLIEANLAYIDVIEPKLIDILGKTVSAKRIDEISAQLASLPDQKIEQSAAPFLSLSSVISQSFEHAAEQDAGSGKATNVSKWKKRVIQTVDGQKGMFGERSRNAWWLALAGVYGSYREELHRRGYYDYADMLVEVINQLQTNPEVRASVQEQFLYVLVDEFQDTNVAQLRLAHLVADHHSSANKPNLMVVGDDDQSIFKFNGAELNNLLSFERMYPATEKIVLEKNYRSSQAVLDVAKNIIEQAQDRMVLRDPSLQKNLVAVNSPETEGEIKHLSYPTVEHQYSAVTSLVKKLHAKQPGQTAILARSHQSLEQVASLLLNQGVPVDYERRSNVLENEAVEQIVLLSEIAVAIKQGNTSVSSQKIADSLRHPMWQLPPKTLWDLAVQNHSRANWLDSLLSSDDKDLKAIGNWLLWLGTDASRMPLTLVMEHIIGLRETEDFTSPVRDYFASKKTLSDEYLQGLSAIRLLRSLASEFTYNHQADLDDFVRLIELSRNNRKIIADESSFVSDEQAVKLLSIHKAKGLEFDHVLLIDCVWDTWKPRGGGRKPPMNLPLQPYGDDYDDYVRLMYVAATRARHTLIFTNYYTDHVGQEVLPAPFLSAALPAEQVPASAVGEPIQVLEQNLRWPRLESANEQALLKSRLENFSLSVTSLLNFLDVSEHGPEFYFERNILRLPDAKTPILAHGTAMHAALQEAQRLINTDSFSIKSVQKAYEKTLVNEHLPPNDHQRYLEKGLATIERLFEEPLLKLPKGSLSEQSLSDIIVGPAIVGGKLDRIDQPDDKHLVIVDYKTGSPLKTFHTKDARYAVKAWKQRMQLTFYAMLAQEKPRFRGREVEGQMVYLDAESPGDLVKSYRPSAEEIQRLRDLIAAVWQHTMKLEFPDTSGYSADFAGIRAFEDDLLADKI